MKYGLRAVAIWVVVVGIFIAGAIALSSFFETHDLRILVLICVSMLGGIFASLIAMASLPNTW
jgi:hypothetical protein